MPKLKVALKIGLAGAKQSDIIKIDDDECENNAYKGKPIDLYATTWACKYIDIDARFFRGAY